MNEPKPQTEPSMEEILASIRRIISEDSPAEESSDEAEPQAEAAADGDVLELTEVVDEPPAEEAGPEPEPETEASAEPEPEPETEAAAEPEPEPEPEPAPAPVREVAETELVSAATATSASGTLAALVAAADPADRAGTPLGEGNRTFEDMVKEVMTPMIRQWLDGNLPGLVERLVRREVERIARRAEDD